MQLADPRIRNLGFAGEIVRPGRRRLPRESLEEDVRACSIGRVIRQSEFSAPFYRQGLRTVAQLHRRSPPPCRGGRPLLFDNATPASLFADHAFELQSRRWMHSIS